MRSGADCGRGTCGRECKRTSRARRAAAERRAGQVLAIGDPTRRRRDRDRRGRFAYGEHIGLRRRFIVACGERLRRGDRGRACAYRRHQAARRIDGRGAGCATGVTDRSIATARERGRSRITQRGPIDHRSRARRCEGQSW